MRILWANCNFLHPTTKGGQIRTLEMLKQLHLRHEIHYVAFEDPEHPEAVAQSREYATKAYPIVHRAWDKRSIEFLSLLARGPCLSTPVAVERWRSQAMKEKIQDLERQLGFDSVVCDFLATSPNIPDLKRAVLFQHNVEAAIWERHQAAEGNALKRYYFGLQAKKMSRYERRVCREVASVIAVSETDAQRFRSDYEVTNVRSIPTGVDLEYFSPPAPSSATSARPQDLVFVGSMDWMPNVNGMEWFLTEVFPLVLKERPGTTVSIVGRKPPASLVKLGSRIPGVEITGTVPDVRPYLWKCKASIVPLLVGGGTRLKIYESVAARRAVVSTTIGAEGLDLRSPDQIVLADTKEHFAKECVRLLNNEQVREEIEVRAWEHVSARYSWDAVAGQFEDILEYARR